MIERERMSVMRDNTGVKDEREERERDRERNREREDECAVAERERRERKGKKKRKHANWMLLFMNASQSKKREGELTNRFLALRLYALSVAQL